MSTYVKVVIKTPGLSVPLLILKLPPDWSVSRLKETITQEHPRNPPSDRQEILYKGIPLRNSQVLGNLDLVEETINVLLGIKPGHGPDTRHRFEGKLLREREEEFLEKYEELVVGRRTEEGFMEEILGRLPIMHYDMVQRLKGVVVRPVRMIRLQGVGSKVYLQWSVLLRGLLFICVLYYLVNSRDRLPNVLILLILYLYFARSVHVRFAVERHMNEQLAQLPRAYLAARAPDLFKVSSREQGDRPQTGVARKGYEFGRAFLWSVLPWFEPEEYAQQRYRQVIP